MNQSTNNNSDFEKTVYEIFDFLKENMVTRSEALTKEDAKNFATKDDLKNFATKDDLLSLVTKDDLREELKKYATKEDFTEFRSEIITHIDEFVKLHQTLDQELVFLRHRQDTFEERLQKLELKFLAA